VAGAVTMFVVLVASAGTMWLRSRRVPVDQHNVNDDWDAVSVPTEAPERVAATAAN